VPSRKKKMPLPRLTHLDAAGLPAMVNVGAKPVTARSAVAEARVLLPAAVARALRATGHRTHKGPVFDTAIIAGVQAVKNTATMIPFCHPLPIDHVTVSIEPSGRQALRIRCSVSTQHRTGVEMEALTGAAVAALTIYDMCKALSHEIRIEGLRLVLKRGGRRDVGNVPRTPRARTGKPRVRA
jgi:cyclic pyranopterin phosphate synthase